MSGVDKVSTENPYSVASEDPIQIDEILEQALTVFRHTRGSINLEPGNMPFQNLVGNSTVPAVGYSPARPCGLTSTLIYYSPP